MSTEPDTTTNDLPIPEGARAAYDEVTVSLLLVAKGLRAPGPATWEDNVRAIAAPMIAAELRRHAEEYRRVGREAGQMEGCDFRSVATDLNRRADEIEAAWRGDPR